MIWTLATMVKYPCSAFFKNYSEHINDIFDSLFYDLNIIESKNYFITRPLAIWFLLSSRLGILRKCSFQLLEKVAFGPFFAGEWCFSSSLHPHKIVVFLGVAVWLSELVCVWLLLCSVVVCLCLPVLISLCYTCGRHHGKGTLDAFQKMGWFKRNLHTLSKELQW